jgi:hypothetical protein
MPDLRFILLLLLVQEILRGRPELRDGIYMLQSRRIENSRKVCRMLGGIHCNLHGTIRDNRNGSFGIPSGAPQYPADWTPGSREVMQIEALTLEGICQRVERSWLIPSRVKLAQVMPSRRS